jgi:hypothetical protein
MATKRNVGRPVKPRKGKAKVKVTASGKKVR